MLIPTHPQKKMLEELDPPLDLTLQLPNKTRFTDNYVEVNHVRYYRLSRNIIFILNEGKPFKAHAAADNGALYVYELCIDDMKYFNSMLYHLIRLKDLRIGYPHYYFPKGLCTFAFAYDRETKMYNALNIPISKCGFIDRFNGRVALKIVGLCVHDKYHIYLDVRVHQIKVDEEDVKTTTECMFDV
jgi:hypothetical protein